MNLTCVKSGLALLVAALLTVMVSTARADSGPVIDQISFSGNHEISTPDLIKRTTLTPGSPLSADAIKRH